MDIKTLKKTILISKKEDKNLSMAYASILKQVEKLTIGVKNAETDEKKLILSATKTELKEQKDSKKEGAPYSQLTIDTCLKVMESFGVKILSERETEVAIDSVISDLELETVTGKDTGKIMKILIEEYGDNLDKSLVNEIMKTKFSK